MYDVFDKRLSLVVNNSPDAVSGETRYTATNSERIGMSCIGSTSPSASRLSQTLSRNGTPGGSLRGTRGGCDGIDRDKRLSSVSQMNDLTPKPPSPRTLTLTLTLNINLNLITRQCLVPGRKDQRIERISALMAQCVERAGKAANNKPQSTYARRSISRIGGRHRRGDVNPPESFFFSSKAGNWVNG